LSHDTGAAALGALRGDIHVHDLDVTDARALGKLATALKGETLDTLINNAGVYGRRQSLGAIDYDEWAEILRVNTLAPIAVSEAFLTHLERASAPRIALITSRMGSIADNTSGGTYAYRASKAALNAAGKSLAVDLQARGIIVLLLHPGWVRTDMGRAGGRLEAPESVRALRQGIDDAEMRHSWGFFAYDGSLLPW
jgi:NAD(P)-dependent dehydrogenase (short-subunit alcohol dehydrogenase family)